MSIPSALATLSVAAVAAFFMQPDALRRMVSQAIVLLIG